MTPEQRERLKRILEDAWGLPQGERAAFARQSAADDPEVLSEVLEMLSQVLPTDFLETPIGDKLSEALHESATSTPRPQQFGKYVIEARIGSGGNGTVYRARQLDLDRVVAIKVLDPLRAMDRATLDRFRREADSIAKLQHPNIIKIFDIGQTDDHHWFAMEFIDGHDLATELAIHRSDPEMAGKTAILERFDAPGGYARCAKMIADVADALETAHQAKIVHRDIKPSNLLLSKSGHITLADFGIALAENLGSITRTGQNPGTLAYMSPEQLRSSKQEIDHRTDIYSLGVVLYETITLRRPFDGETDEEIQRKIENSDPLPIHKLAPNTPRALAYICRFSIQFDFKNRYFTALEMKNDLASFAEDREIKERPVRSRKALIITIISSKYIVLVSAFLISSIAIYATLRSGSFREVPASTIRIVGDRPVVGSLSYRVRDDTRETVGPEVFVGELPLDDVLIPSGPITLIIHHKSGATLEMTRYYHSREDPYIETIASGFEERQNLVPMVPVSGATFPIPATDGLRFACRMIGSTVSIGSFQIDKYEVTIGSYKKFLLATGRPAPAHWRDWNGDVADENKPVAGISFLDARAYAEWMGKRLPTHLEWELASRGTDRRSFPWGNTSPATNIANIGMSRNPTRDGPLQDWLESLGRLRPVDSMPAAATASGIHHLLGNVAEYVDTPTVEIIDGRAEASIYNRLVMGGSWADASNVDLRYHARNGIDESSSSPLIGFRCAMSLPNS